MCEFINCIIFVYDKYKYNVHNVILHIIHDKIIHYCIEYYY